MALMNSLYGKYPAFYVNPANYKEFYSSFLQGRVPAMPSAYFPGIQLPTEEPTEYVDKMKETLPRKLSHRLPEVQTGNRSPKSATSASSSSSNVSSPTRVCDTSPKTNFSIEGILGKRDRSTERPESDSEAEQNESTERDDDSDANSENSNKNMKTNRNLGERSSEFSWLQCTRYKPPKLPRSKKHDGVKKRKLGRNPRVPFTQHQVGVLEQKFRQTHYLSSVDVLELSAALNLTETRVKIWFQNRRARERRDRECKKNGGPLNTIIPSTPGGMPGYPTAFPWPIALKPNPAAMAHFTQALQFGTASAFTPLPFIYTPTSPTLSRAGPVGYHIRSPEQKE